MEIIKPVKILFCPGTFFRKLILMLSGAFCFIHVSAQKAEAGWQLKKAENGVTVYTRNAENSAYKELKATVVVKTSLSSIVSLLNDWDTYPQWVYRCGKSSTVKRISETELIHYQTVEAPWPVDSRDFVVNVKLVQDALTKVITITSTSKPDLSPKVPSYVRIIEFKASWTLIPLKDGNVQAVYQLLVNPGGYVPAWLVNLAVVDGPYETTLHFKDWVMKDKYQGSKVPYIKD